MGPNETDYPNEFTYPYKGRNNDYFLAGGEKNVDQKKVDATEAISEAKRAAGETHGTFQHN